MRIAYFINTFDGINWGGQATSNGIKNLVEKNYPDAEFVPLDLPPLPFKKIPLLRKHANRSLANAVLEDDVKGVEKSLSLLNIPTAIFEGFDTVCFNGEGAIHSKSGHLIRLMGMLYYFKQKGAAVTAMSQTVDVKENPLGCRLLTKVYKSLDHVTAREPVSVRELVSLGIDAKLLPDAAYALPRLTEADIQKHTRTLNLPEKFIGVTGSSALKKTSTEIMDCILTLIQKHYHLPIVFLANAKTDIRLAKQLKDKHNLQIIAPPVKYDQAMAVIARAHMIIGGRQHPNIFAAMHKVPFIPFAGNTHKMDGVVELLNYPLKPIAWEQDQNTILESFQNADRLVDTLCKISAPYPTELSLSPKA